MKHPLHDFAKTTLTRMSSNIATENYTVEAYAMANRPLGMREHSIKLEMPSGDWVSIVYTQKAQKSFDKEFGEL